MSIEVFGKGVTLNKSKEELILLAWVFVVLIVGGLISTIFGY